MKQNRKEIGVNRFSNNPDFSVNVCSHMFNYFKPHLVSGCPLCSMPLEIILFNMRERSFYQFKETFV